MKHSYTFYELQPRLDGRGPYAQPYLRFLILFKKKADVSEAYFHQHWKTVHADLTMAAEDVGIQLLRYVQVSCVE
jgi:hypothetical protein